MGQRLKIAVTLAGVAAIALPLLWITVTDGPPQNLTVSNRTTTAADCTAAFARGELWTFSLAPNETKKRLFLFGAPVVATLECRSGQRLLQVSGESGCSEAGQRYFAVGDENSFQLYC